jgi:DNA-binding IclR family transcriptional regulator
MSDPHSGAVGDQSPIGSVDKALCVLRELAVAGPGGLSLAAVADRVAVSRPTIHRTLAALRFRGFAQQNPEDGRYVLGPAAMRLANDYLTDDHLPRLLHPVLVALCARTEELVHLGILTGNEVVYLDKVEPRRTVRVWSAVGGHAPAASTALGRALIAYQNPHRSAMAWYARALPANSRCGEEDLWHAIVQTRARGFALEEQEHEPGISCLAVPLLRGGGPVAAVSITAPTDRMGIRRIREFSRIVPDLLRDLLPDGITLPPELT